MRGHNLTSQHDTVDCCSIPLDIGACDGPKVLAWPLRPRTWLVTGWEFHFRTVTNCQPSTEFLYLPIRQQLPMQHICSDVLRHPRARHIMLIRDPLDSNVHVNVTIFYATRLCTVQLRSHVILRSECRGTRWRTGGEVKGKLANGVGSQYSHTTSEHGVSSITNADAHTSAASSRLNWFPRLFKWTRPFRRKMKCGFCTCAIRFRTSSTFLYASLCWN